MKESLYNIKISQSEQGCIICNTVSGAIDVARGIEFNQNSFPLKNADPDTLTYLSDRGYILPRDMPEQDLLKTLYTGLLRHHRAATPPKFVFLLTYNCNLRCSYCWQKEQLKRNRALPGSMNSANVDKALDAIAWICDSIVENEHPPLIQLFGGEPLLPENRGVVEHLLASCGRKGWHTQITTNGYYLDHFLDLINTYRVGEVQITLDGTEKVHENRRRGSDYRNLLDTVDRVLRGGVTTVKIRINTDLSNLTELPALADEIIDRHWHSNRRFYAYLAPLRDQTFEDMPLLKARPALISRLEELMLEEPKTRIFDLLGWGPYQATLVYRRTGRFPFPRPYICEANLNQFVFEPGGQMYLCPEETGNRDSVVGQYYPELAWNDKVFSEWYERSPLELEQCRECGLLPVCGGGCQLWIKRNSAYKAFCPVARASFLAGLLSGLEVS